MEQIIYDFIRLEDDIVDDLCRDLPMSNNYERFSIAKSVDFERRKLETLLETRHETPGKFESRSDFVVTARELSRDVECNCSLEKKCSFCLQRANSASTITNGSERSDFEDENVFYSPNDATKTSYRFDFHAEPCRRRQSVVLCEELSRRGSCRDILSSLQPIEVQRMKLDLTDPIITKSEVFEADEPVYIDLISSSKQRKSSGDMKIKIEMVQDYDIPFQEDGEVDQSKLENLGSEKSKTARIKFRVPKEIIDKENKSCFSKQLMSYLSKRISSGVSLNDGEMLHWTMN